MLKIARTLMLSATVLLVVGSLNSVNADTGISDRVYKLGVGDRLRITVFDEPDLSGEFEISAEGYVRFPLVGQINAVGVTLANLEEAIIAALKQGFLKSPRVSIEVLNYRPFYILGEVNAPGSYPYVSGMTVLNAVALAGGFTYRADEDDIMLTRPGDDQEVNVRLEEFVLPGDILEVEERFF